MNKNFNINLLNMDSRNKVLTRGEIINEIKIKDEFSKGEIIVPKGTKGWLEWEGTRLTFEFDEAFKYPNWHGSVYRLDYYKKSRKVKSQIRTYEANNEERIEYLVRYINVKRSVRGLNELNPNNIRFALDMALTSGIDLDKAIQIYLDDIEIQVKAK